MTSVLTRCWPKNGATRCRGGRVDGVVVVGVSAGVVVVVFEYAQIG